MEKSNVLMLLQEVRDCDLRHSNRSLINAISDKSERTHVQHIIWHLLINSMIALSTIKELLFNIEYILRFVKEQKFV